MTALDWAWSIAGIAILGAAAFALLRLFLGSLHLGPSFMTMEPLTSGRYWILAVWLPFWVLNIFGEELLWRGVVLPRQETAFGKWAWGQMAADGCCSTSPSELRSSRRSGPCCLFCRLSFSVGAILGSAWRSMQESTDQALWRSRLDSSDKEIEPI